MRTRLLRILLVILGLLVLSDIMSNDTETTGVLSVDDIFGSPLKAEDILMPKPEDDATEGTLDVKSLEEEPTAKEEESLISIEVGDITPPEKTVEQQIQEAVALAQKGEAQQAIIALRAIAMTNAQDSHAPEALYHAAMLEERSQDIFESLQEIVSSYPGTEWGRRSQVAIGDIYYGEGKYNEAIQQFLQVARQTEKGAIAIVARLKIAECLIKQKDYGKALILLNTLLQHEEEARKMPELYDTMATCFLENNRLEDTRTIYEYMIENFPGYKELPRIYLRLGLIEELSGKTDTAANIYKMIIAKYQHSSECELASKRLNDLRTPFFTADDEPLTSGTTTFVTE